MFCSRCGRKLPDGCRTCSACGQNQEAALQQPIRKNLLTREVIAKSIKKTKTFILWHIICSVSVLFLLFGVISAIITLEDPQPLMFGLLVAGLLEIRNIVKDRKVSKSKYVVMERNCVQKEFIDGLDGPDSHWLYFVNANATSLVRIDADTGLFSRTAAGQPFYVVFLEKRPKDIVVFPKSEWELSPEVCLCTGSFPNAEDART